MYDFDVPDQAGMSSCEFFSTRWLIPDKGTFWYHSHEGVQYCDGLRGPLVIYDEHDPHRNMYDVDDGKPMWPSIHPSVL